MSTQYDKNKQFLFSDECTPDTPLAAEFAKNLRLFMAAQKDFNDEDRSKYHDKLQRDIDRAREKLVNHPQEGSK